MWHKVTSRDDTHSALSFLLPRAVRDQDVLIQGGGGATGLADNKATLCLIAAANAHQSLLLSMVLCLFVCEREIEREGGMDVCTLHINYPPDYASLFTVRWRICNVK